MNGEGRFFRWASRILAVVCLVLLVLNLLRPSGEEKSPSISEPALAVSESAAAERNPLPPPQFKRARTQARTPSAVAAVSPPPFPASRARLEKSPTLSAVPPRGGAGSDRRLGVSLSAVRDRRYSRDADARVQAIPPPEPAVTTLKPLGYVERADGTVEAVVADGPYVAVLREGELFQDEYRVAKVTTTLVEIVKQPVLAAPQVADLAAPPGLEREVAAIQRPASEPASPAAIHPAARREPQGPPSRASSEETLASKPLENKGKRLQQPEPPHALAESRGDSRGPEVAKSAGPRPTPAPAPTRAPTQSPPEPARTLKPLGYVEWASGRLQAVVEDQGEVYLVSEGEVFGDRYRALRVTESSVEVVEGLSPPARASPMELAAREVGQRSATQPSIEVAHSPPPQKPAEKVDRASQESVDSALAASIPGRGVPGSPRTGTLPTLGYVQKQSGEVEAILADGDQVRIVRPGDVVAGKYFALSVSRSSVEVGSVADGGLPSSAGAQAEDSGGGAAVVLAAGSNPVPMNVVEKAALREEVKTEAGQPAIPALEPHGSGRLTAASVTTLGYVEMADGRVEMIVADGDRVDLVHDGFEWGEDRQAVGVSRSVGGVVENPSLPLPAPEAKGESGERPALEPPLVAASHSPPRASRDAAGGQDEGPGASETASGLAYLVTHVHSPRFNFDLHVRLPDNRSD